jgi:hypothetical protein
MKYLIQFLVLIILIFILTSKEEQASQPYRIKGKLSLYLFYIVIFRFMKGG